MEIELKKKKRNTAHARFHLLRFSKRMIKFATAIFEETEKKQTNREKPKTDGTFYSKAFSSNTLNFFAEYFWRLHPREFPRLFERIIL